jgi:hypothetical protein
MVIFNHILSRTSKPESVLAKAFAMRLISLFT